MAANAEAWNHIDNFTLVDGAATPAVRRTWGSVKSVYRQ
jgi:hypothetical protein